MSLMDFDYSPFVEQIHVTKDAQGNCLYNGARSLYTLLGHTPGIKEVWDTMTFSQRCALTAEMHTALGVVPSADVDEPVGRVLGCFASYIEDRDDWLIEVIDPHDESLFFVDWLSELRMIEVMENEHDVAGLQDFLYSIGELLTNDQIVEAANPKFRGQGPEAL